MDACVLVFACTDAYVRLVCHAACWQPLVLVGLGILHVHYVSRLYGCVLCWLLVEKWLKRADLWYCDDMDLALPFLHRTEHLLLPLIVIFALFVSTLMLQAVFGVQINFAHISTHYYYAP